MRSTARRPQRYIVVAVDRFGMPRATGSALTLNAALLDAERNARDYILERRELGDSPLPTLRLVLGFDPQNEHVYKVLTTVYPQTL